MLMQTSDRVDHHGHQEVALYSRVSTDRQTTENQLLELRAVAERHNWIIVDEYIDQGISGAKDATNAPSSIAC